MTGPTREEVICTWPSCGHSARGQCNSHQLTALRPGNRALDILAAENAALRERLEAAEADRDDARRIADHDKALWLKAEAALTEARAREAAAWEAGRVKPLEWDHDGRRFSLDDTMAMSSSYNWDGYECCRQEGYGLGCGYIIWPDRIASDRWNLYATFDGLYIQDIAGEEAAKAAAQADYEARILSALVTPPTDATAALTAVKDAELERAAAEADACPDSHWGPWIASRIRALRRNPKEDPSHD